MRLASLPLAAIGLLAAVPAQAGCVSTDIVQDTTRVATVRPGSARVHFVQVDALRRHCPDASTACRAPAYVIPGDAVLVAHREGAFTCAAFVDARGVATVLFLPTAALASAPSAFVPSFAGDWTAPEQALEIRAARGRAFSVRGDATWGRGDRRRAENGGVHTGEVEGVARPAGGVLAFTQGQGATLPYGQGDEFDCRLRLFRRGPYLLARDNNNCGGVNVSFSGIYIRKR